MSSFKIIQIERSASDQVIQLLDENIIGTPGKSMLYRHAEVKQKISKTPDPFFANVSIRNKLYGTICLSRRNVRILGELHQAFYLRYFTFHQQIRANSTSTTRDRGRSSEIREEVCKLMDGEGLDFDGDLILFAYVDSNNVRSKKLIDEFDFKPLGDFHVFTFSRLFPKINDKVKKLDFAELGDINHLLTDFYDKEQLVPTVMVDKEDDYYVLSHHNEIICGVKATRDSWIIKRMPGFMGALMMKVVHRLPVLGRLFNPHYRFLFLDAIYCKNGYASALETLMESVLAIHSMHTGIICLDPRSRNYHLLESLNLGLTHRLMGKKKIDIVAKTARDKLLDPHKPCYVAGQDVL